MLVPLVFVLLLSFCAGLHVLDCPYFPHQPVEVNISNCEKQPCLFPKGVPAIMNLTFEVDQDVKDVQAAIQAHAFGIWTNYPLEHPQVCDRLTNGECPLDTGEVVTYRLEMPILKEYPTVSILVDISLQNEKKEKLCCFRFAAEVVDS